MRTLLLTCGLFALAACSSTPAPRVPSRPQRDLSAEEREAMRTEQMAREIPRPDWDDIQRQDQQRQWQQQQQEEQQLQQQQQQQQRDFGPIAPPEPPEPRGPM